MMLLTTILMSALLVAPPQPRQPRQPRTAGRPAPSGAQVSSGAQTPAQHPPNAAAQAQTPAYGTQQTTPGGLQPGQNRTAPAAPGVGLPAGATPITGTPQTAYGAGGYQATGVASGPPGVSQPQAQRMAVRGAEVTASRNLLGQVVGPQYSIYRGPRYGYVQVSGILRQHQYSKPVWLDERTASVTARLPQAPLGDRFTTNPTGRPRAFARPLSPRYVPVVVKPPRSTRGG